MKSLILISVMCYLSMTQQYYCNSSTTCGSCQNGFFLTRQKQCKPCPKQCDTCFLNHLQYLKCINPISNGYYILASVASSQAMRVNTNYLDLNIYQQTWQRFQFKTEQINGTSSIKNHFFGVYIKANCDNGSRTLQLVKEESYEWIIKRVIHNVFTIKNVKCGYLYGYRNKVTIVQDQEDTQNILWVIKSFPLPHSDTNTAASNTPAGSSLPILPSNIPSQNPPKN